ncbi:hypothetical protein GW17_00012537 [Ensete ventricosum]|nr:hypothetical protein GW17_00012537 [Ensete ventricosum]
MLFLSGFLQEVCFMLPPLLDFLLDCAKKTDQSVVCISLGALVHLVEVGGHQFGDSDWDTLLKSIRYASFSFSVGFPSPSDSKQKPAVAASVQRSQTFGQRIMGNMMDNLFLRSFTSKSKNDTDDLGSVSPAKVGGYSY